MSTNTLITLLSITLPLLGAGIGYLLRQRIERRRELLSEINKERRGHYQQFVDLITDLLQKSNTGDTLPQNEMREKLYEFHKKYVLYASSQVVNSFGNFFQFLYANSEQLSDIKNMKTLFRKMTRVILDMRKDIGLKNRHLGRDGQRLIRALITNYDSIMK